MITFGRYLFLDGRVPFRRMKTHHCLSETEGSSSNLEICVKYNVSIEMAVMYVSHIASVYNGIPRFEANKQIELGNIKT